VNMNDRNASTISSANCRIIAAATLNADGELVIPEHLLEDYQIAPGDEFFVSNSTDSPGLRLTRADELTDLIGLVRECLHVLDSLDRQMPQSTFTNRS
jgi:hypothetical protein